MTSQLPEAAQVVIIGGGIVGCSTAYHLADYGFTDVVVLERKTLSSGTTFAAAGMLGQDRRDIGVLAVTSADRLNAGWQAAQRQRMRGNAGASSHVERLLGDLPRHARVITVIDGHPATLSWLGGVGGHVTVGLGVEHFGQTGRVADLYRHYGIDAAGIARIAGALSPGRPLRDLRVVQ